MKTKRKKYSAEFIEKAARLLKGENLSKEEQSKYHQHSLNRKKYKRLSVHVNNVDDQWEIDLAEIKALSKFNNQFRYWLVCIDVYSRYCWVELLKKKSAKNTAVKFEKILKKKNGGYPKKIQCDEGSEFQDIRKLLSKRYGFSVFSTYNREIKASHVERVIGTLKQMVQRVITMTGESDYKKYLPIILNRYNNSPHKSLGGETPAIIYSGKKKNKIARVLIRKMLTPVSFTTHLLKEGAKVRITKAKKIFEKSSLRRWSNEKFIIKKVFITDPVTYELKDLKGEEITGIFYREELQATI